MAGIPKLHDRSHGARQGIINDATATLHPGRVETEVAIITQDQIDAAVAILVREARPEKVILFGSYARGDARPDSDLDLLVVEKEVRHPQAEMARLRRALSPLRIAVDILVTDTNHLSSSWAEFPGSYLYDALREGLVLYAVDGTGSPAAA